MSSPPATGRPWPRRATAPESARPRDSAFDVWRAAPRSAAIISRKASRVGVTGPRPRRCRRRARAHRAPGQGRAGRRARAAGDGRGRLRPAIEQEEHEQESGSSLLLQARARSRATGTGSAANGPAPTVWRSSFQIVSGIAMPSPSTSAPSGRAAQAERRPRPQPVGGSDAVQLGTDGRPGRAGATTAARRRSETRIVGYRLARGHRQAGDRASIQIERHRAQQRQKDRVVGHRRPQRETGARHRGAGEAGEVRIGRDVQGHEAVEPELDGCGVVGERGTDHRGLGPWRALGGPAPTASQAGEVCPAANRARSRSASSSADGTGGACASSSSAAFASPIASRRSTQAQERSGAASARPGAASRVRCSSRKVGSSIAVGSRRSRSAISGGAPRAQSGPSPPPRRAGRRPRCRRRQVLHADRRCGLARTRPNGGGSAGNSARGASWPAAGRLTSQVAGRAGAGWRSRPNVAVARRARRSRPDGLRRDVLHREEYGATGDDQQKARGAGAAGQGSSNSATGARIADGHDGTRRKLTVASHSEMSGFISVRSTQFNAEPDVPDPAPAHEPPGSPPPWRLGRTIVLVGLMGAGKTSIGRRPPGRLAHPSPTPTTRSRPPPGSASPTSFSR